MKKAKVTSVSYGEVVRTENSKYIIRENGSKMPILRGRF